MDTKILLEQFQLVNFQKGKRITLSANKGGLKTRLSAIDNYLSVTLNLIRAATA